jgi:hypothetical protein
MVQLPGHSFLSAQWRAELVEAKLPGWLVPVILVQIGSRHR